MSETKKGIFSKIAACVFLALIAYLPFHIFVSIVLGVNVGLLGPLKASKDIAVALIALLLVPYALSHKKEIKKLLFHSWLGGVSLAYISLNLLFYLIDRRDLDSATLGLVYNTRFVVVLILAYILAQAQPKLVNARVIAKIVVVGGAVVAGFGILQYFVLPKDFFARLGYSMQSGALPWFYIDNKTDFLRIMSTMRDPNSLGSYLLIPISLLLAKLQIDGKKLSSRAKAKMVALGAILILALFLALSRSAVLGLIVVVAVSLVVANIKKIQQNIKLFSLLALVGVGVVVLAGTIFMQANPRGFKNLVFHADEKTVLRDPNELRVDFLKRSVSQISHKPYGDGLGTAGLASMKNNVEGINLTENYYLQIGIETGVVGLILFLALCATLGIRIFAAWLDQRTFVALALISSFCALIVTNMLAHIWTNETIAIIWWGLAGTFLGQQAFQHSKAESAKKVRTTKTVR